VTWIDTGPAIAEQTARMVATLGKDNPAPDIALMTGDIGTADRYVFRRFGFSTTTPLSGIDR
jgi:hypothetical protein